MTQTNELTPRQIYRREYYQKNKSRAQELIKKRYIAKKQELLEYQKEYRKQNREIINQKSSYKKKQRQLEAIEYLGGKCLDCSVSYPPIVYDFHHTNPDEKEFILSEHWSDSKEKLWNELNKCILLCSNCHRLRHQGS